MTNNHSYAHSTRTKRAKATDPVLIGISLVSFGENRLVVPYGICRSATLLGKSNTQDANFYFETRLLPPAMREEYEHLEQHGFTVVEPPKQWRYGSSLEWQGQVIQEAIKKVVLHYRDAESLSVSDYESDLRNSVLEAINKAYPHAINMLELKHDLDPEPSDSNLLTALDALTIDKLIDVQSVRGPGNSLEAFALARITTEGRKNIKLEPQSPSLSGTVIHGDQIIFHGSSTVGAIGRDSHGTIYLNSAWDNIRQNVDFGELAVELEKLRLEYRRIAITREDDRQVHLLGDAAEEAEKGDGQKAATLLSRVGHKTLEIAKNLGSGFSS